MPDPIELPKRGAIVRVEKVANQVISGNHTSNCYRLTMPDGTPLEVGLFVNVDFATDYCKQRGWRPEVASIPTYTPPKPKAVAKTSPKTNQIGLGLGD